MVFQRIFWPAVSASPGMFPFRVWAWTFASMDSSWFSGGDDFLCLAVDVVCYAAFRLCIQFGRHTVECLLYPCVCGVNHMFRVSYRWNGSERIRTRGVPSSFPKTKCSLRVFLLWLRCFFCSRSGSVFCFSIDSLIAMHCTSNVDCKFGRTEGSRSGVHNEFVHAVLFG